MERSVAVAAALCAVLLFGAAVCRATDRTVEDIRTGQTGVEVQGVKLAGGIVRGTIVNGSLAEVRDLRLLIRYVWLWKNERRPGDDNPGRSDYHDIAGPIGPGASAAFEHSPVPPLPLQRTDGRFQVEVSIVGLTQVER